ncbi:uncharacterized protein FOMMEDRAFT_76349 [Fomitiporia mediterranea MF3/22]|uniref:uncharacterized protein n=1 Tax=Fomitiporia mediterranea (strain MF3/22) TaxID=694068 RepID=UPI00044075A5|nr:uncharacterized protein FOMMEDRAFT_76349 [Fomitiporia mediterranea MF3/22]EJD06950.1 hypothetical protein FOMMEDRAFT_76349 [Fomitiporia mediterranea MF3/22]
MIDLWSSSQVNNNNEQDLHPPSTIVHNSEATLVAVESTIHEGDKGDSEEEKEDDEEQVLIPKVTFFPSLNDTRRAWILCRLREECVISVLDIGCGEGTLLSCLCNPPAFLDTSKENKEQEQRFDEIYSSSTDGLPDLHISHLAGLDIASRALTSCIARTAPESHLFQYHRDDLPRWEPLEVNIWHGSLSVYNPEFVDVECIVSTEVIEHLPEDVLPEFAPTLLGIYRPRLLLITTPNYAFNARFSAPGRSHPGGIPDPTHRTNRAFRHSDHKFEWTPAEFKEYCTEAASAWGYTVEVDAIGLAREPDPWGRDEELGGASQVALFRRIDTWQGRKHTNALPPEESAHKLLATHTHTPHPQTGKPESYDSVCELVSKHMMSYYFDEGYSIWDLWVGNTISIACGGRLDVLLDAIDSSPEMSLFRMEGVQAREWRVKFTGEKHEEAVEAAKKTHYWSRSPLQSPHNPIKDDEQSQNGYKEVTSNWPQIPLDWSRGAEEWWSLGDEAE